MSKRLIRRKEVLSKVGLSQSCVYNLEKSGDFPRHILITPRCAAWDEAEVDAWIDSRKTSATPSAIYPDVKLRLSKSNRLPNVNITTKSGD